VKEKTLGTKMLHDGKFLKFIHHDIEIESDPPLQAIRQFIMHPGGVCVVPITDEGKIVLVEQFRKPVERYVLEIPAGKIDPGEDTLVTAKRELQEETGFQAEEWHKLGEIIPCPGYSDEILYLYLAKKLSPGDQNLDLGEFVTCQEFSFHDVKKLILENKIQDAKTISAIFLAEKLITNNS
jgi:ADP-ribose pyrophosphatase